MKKHQSGNEPFHVLMTSTTSKIRTKLSNETLYVSLLLVLATGLRFYHLGGKGLGGDEIWTASWSQPGLLHIVQNLTRPPDMPVIYILVHLSTELGAKSEFWVRFPSAFFGAAAVYYLYRLTRLWLGQRSALIAALLLAVSPLHIWYSQDARYYALLSVLTLGTVYYAYRALTNQKYMLRDWLSATLFVLLSVYTHLSSIWYLLSLALFATTLIIIRQLKPAQSRLERIGIGKPLAISGGVILLFSLPFLRLVLPILQTGIGPTGEGLARIGSHPAVPFFMNWDFLQQLGMLFSGGRNLQLLMLPLLIVGWLRLYEIKKDASWLILLLIISPLTTSLFIEFIHNITFKYFIYLLPFFLMLVASGIDAISRLPSLLIPRSKSISPNTQIVLARFQNLILAILILVIGWLHGQPLTILYQQAKVNDWRSAAQFLDSQVRPGDLILTEKWGRPALSYYLARQSDVEIISVRGRDWQQIKNSFDGTIWFVGLKGKTEEQIAQLHPPIPSSSWQQKALLYNKPLDAPIFFPITEDELTIYRLQKRVPRRYDFMGVANVAWTDKTYSELSPSQRRNLLLRLDTQSEYSLQLAYLDQKGRNIEVYVNDVLLGTVMNGTNSGDWQMTSWPIMSDASSVITVTLRATGSRNAIFDWIALQSEDSISSQPATNRQNSKRNIALPRSVWIIGDSLTRGLFASSEKNTYRNVLFSKLQERYPMLIHTTFWNGVCTLGGLEEQWSSWPGQPDILFIELGINDLGNEDCILIPDEVWQQHYGAMLDRIQQDAPGVQIVVGTIPWSGWKPGTDIYRRAQLFNTWIIAEAGKRNVPVADLWSATVGREDGLSRPEESSVFPPYHGDNFHPNDRGHQRLAETFFNAYRVNHSPLYHPLIITP